MSFSMPTRQAASCQHPGWPLTINQMDNYGREAVAWLPVLKIKGDTDPVIQVTNQSTGEMEYTVRIIGNEFIPKVFSKDKFSVKIGYPEKNLFRELKDIESEITREATQLEFVFN